MAAGADFRLLGPRATMLRVEKPVVSVCAVRTGCGQEPDDAPRRSTSSARRASASPSCGTRCRTATWRSRRCSASRATTTSTAADCTIEEREEYEPHLDEGNRRLRRRRLRARSSPQAEQRGRRHRLGRRQQRPAVLSARPADRRRRSAPARPRAPLPPGRDEPAHGATSCVINKIDTAPPEGVEAVRDNIRRANPRREVVVAASPIHVEDPDDDPRQARAGGRGRADADARRDDVRRGRAGRAAARRRRARRSAAVRGRLDPRRRSRRYPQIGRLLPAMGYGRADGGAARRRSSGPTPTSSSSGRRSTCDASSTSTSRRCASPTTCRRWASRRSLDLLARDITTAAALIGAPALPCEVVALGGNALPRPGQRGTAAEHLANLARRCAAVEAVLESDGGRHHARERPPGRERAAPPRAAADEVPPLPLWIAVAQTQAEIGTLEAANSSPWPGGRSPASSPTSSSTRTTPRSATRRSRSGRTTTASTRASSRGTAGGGSATSRAAGGGASSPRRSRSTWSSCGRADARRRGQVVIAAGGGGIPVAGATTPSTGSTPSSTRTTPRRCWPCRSELTGS